MLLNKKITRCQSSNWVTLASFYNIFFDGNVLNGKNLTSLHRTLYVRTQHLTAFFKFSCSKRVPVPRLTGTISKYPE